jgi:hypothetical protein
MDKLLNDSPDKGEPLIRPIYSGILIFTGLASGGLVRLAGSPLEYVFGFGRNDQFGGSLSRFVYVFYDQLFAAAFLMESLKTSESIS